MKKLLLLAMVLGLLSVSGCFSTSLTTTNGQEVEAPVINIGSKWLLRTDNGQEWRLEAIGEENGKYIILRSISGGIWKGEWKQFYDKKTMNCVKVLDGSGREENSEFKGSLEKYYNFPLYSGKKWGYTYTTTHGMGAGGIFNTISSFLVVGFEEVNVTAGRFRAIKVQNEQTALGGCHCSSRSYRKNYFWYSPDVKTIIKFEKDPHGYKIGSDYMKYELISFELK